MVFAVGLDGEEQLYLAFHIDGKPVLRNGVFGKRYGKHAGDESAGKADKRTFMYITKASALELYDVLGGIFGGDTARESPSAQDMETPSNSEVTINDMLGMLEDDK
jgi:hypothetical protein